MVLSLRRAKGLPSATDSLFLHSFPANGQESWRGTVEELQEANLDLTNDDRIPAWCSAAARSLWRKFRDGQTRPAFFPPSVHSLKRQLLAHQPSWLPAWEVFPWRLVEMTSVELRTS